MANRLQSLPNVRSLVVPHAGLAPEEEKTAKERGYKLVDVRLLEGLEMVERALQAAIMGTAVFNDAQLSALRLSHDLFKNRPTGSAKSDSLVKDQTDAMAILSAIPRSKAFEKAAKENEEKAPSRQSERLADFGSKKGRPVGTKPRQLEPSAYELEQEALDKAFEDVAQELHDADD